MIRSCWTGEVVPEGIRAQDDGYWDRAYQSVLLGNVRTCRVAVDLMLGAPGATQRALAWWRSVASSVTANAPCSVHVVRIPERKPVDEAPAEAAPTR